MSQDVHQLHEALAKIAEIASAAVNGGGYPNGTVDEDRTITDLTPQDHLVCTPKALPKRLAIKAAETARRINPVNAPMMGPLAEFAPDVPLDPQSIAVLTSRYWGPTARRLTVSFMETTASALRTRIISHMNAWTRTIGISFVETSGVGDVRISRGPGGYWSYLGTDIRLIPRNRQTMNLQGFTMSTPESEYKRVIRHETGHTLGFPHEHMRKVLVARIDPAKAYEYFLRTQGWNKQMVDQQVLTPLDERSLMGTPADQTSIMCYQLPGAITRDGQPILGGVDINQTDYTFAGRIYPKPGHITLPEQSDDWDESEDAETAV